MSICQSWKQVVQTHREVISQVLKHLPPATHDGIPYLITMRDVGVNEGFPEDHA